MAQTLEQLLSSKKAVFAARRSVDKLEKGREMGRPGEKLEVWREFTKMKLQC